MSFSEKMRESLGAGGVGLKVAPTAEEASVTAGTALRANVTLDGGNRSAHVDALVLRLIEADRHWTDADGNRIEEADAAALEDRRHLTAGWDRRTVAELRVGVDVEIDVSGSKDVDVSIDVPGECKPTSVSCAHTLNVQADIKGQIDPTANARVVVQSG